jgi:DpnII restriction endonuclease
MRTTDEKFQTIIEKNTFYFYNPIFQEEYESHLNSVKETLLVLKNRIETQGLQKSHFTDLLAEKEHGLAAILALTGFSKEFFKRLVTIIRVVDDPELSTLALKDKWCEMVSVENIGEWGSETIQRLIRRNEHFRMGIVNIFFEGATNPFLSRTLPLFELKKLGILKLGFDISAILDTLVRYKEKGSYSGKKENNSERLIAKLLDELEITFETGDLNELIQNAFETKRTMDFIIPNKQNPQVIIESSFLVTTSSSGQGDKAKTEINVSQLIKQHYPSAKFVGFVDGIGWYVRKKDLRRMVTAFDEVFTLDKSELARFERFLVEEIKK